MGRGADAKIPSALRFIIRVATGSVLMSQELLSSLLVVIIITVCTSVTLWLSLAFVSMLMFLGIGVLKTFGRALGLVRQCFISNVALHY